MSESFRDLVVSVVRVIFFIVGENGSDESRAFVEPSCPGKRHQSIRTYLSGEVESSSSPIWRHASDVKYPKKVKRRLDPNVRYLDEVERRPDIIAAVRHPGGMSAEKYFGCDISGWNERCHVSQGRERHVAYFREDPTNTIW